RNRRSRTSSDRPTRRRCLVWKLPLAHTVRDANGPEWRRLPVGAEVGPAGGVHFRGWGPKADRGEVDLGDRRVALGRGPAGYHGALVPSLEPGARYRYRLDGGPSYPDPASRCQPEGPHGPSEVVDPRSFRWTDGSWRGGSALDRVVYELHIGTFTSEGTWA